MSPRVQGISPDPFPHERVGAGYKVREGGGEGRGRGGKGEEPKQKWFVVLGLSDGCL